MLQSKEIGREENRPSIHLRNCCIARRLIRNIVKVVWTRKEYNHWETEGLIWKKNLRNVRVICEEISPKLVLGGTQPAPDLLSHASHSPHLFP